MHKIKYLFMFCVVVFVLTSIHLWYQYVAYSSDKIPTKGGTVIEWTIQKISYLPYLSMSRSDKRYQHLLYRGCISLWSGNQLTGDICTLTTTDNKSYTVSINPNLTWSDGTSITVNDIYFTYYDIIKSNIWNLSFLDSYGKLDIRQNDDGTLTVQFPRESIDNQLFFINPILPAQYLTDQPLSYYQTQFAITPITSACASLKSQNIDKSSVIFNLTNCVNYVPQLLQIKQFADNDELNTYIQSNPSVIDYVIDGESDDLTQYGIASTQTIISYFHVNTISDSTRRQLASLFTYTLNQQDMSVTGLIKYDGMFNTKDIVDWNTIKRNLGILQEAPTPLTSWDIASGSTAATEATPTATASTIPLLTTNVLAYGTNKYKTAYLPSQKEKFTISFKFDEAYDKVAVAANGPVRYFPESYNPDTKTADYNIATSFNNLVVGKNTYTVRGYKWDQVVTLLNLTLYYNQKPSSSEDYESNTSVSTNLDGTRSIRIVYITHPVIEDFITHLKTILSRNGMLENFAFKWVESVSQLEDIVAAKSYEVIIKPIDLGMRNDLSILVHDDPMINNAQYKNQTLKNYLTDLNQSSDKTKQKLITAIQDIYRKDMPFMIVGKTMDYIGVSAAVERNPDTQTSVNTVRDQLLNHIRLVYSLKINHDQLRSPNHLINFLIGSRAH